MKTIAYKTYNRIISYVPYPNAASRREVLQKLLDTAVVAVSGMGLAAMLLLLMIL